MAKEFQYKAIDATGRHVTDSINAENALEAKQKLFEAGLVATEIEEKIANQTQGWRRYFEKRLSTRDLILFTQQFRTLLMPVLRCQKSLKRSMGKSVTAPLR